MRAVDTDPVAALYRRSVCKLALQKAECVALLEGGFLSVEVADQVGDVIVIYVLAVGLTESHALFVTCVAERQGRHVYVRWSAERRCRENGHLNLAVALGIDLRGIMLMVVIPGTDIDFDGHWPCRRWRHWWRSIRRRRCRARRRSGDRRGARFGWICRKRKQPARRTGGERRTGNRRQAAVRGDCEPIDQIVHTGRARNVEEVAVLIAGHPAGKRSTGCKR